MKFWAGWAQGSLILADAENDDPLEFSGETTIPFLTAYDDATINVYGTDLSSTLLDGNYQGGFSEYQLTGFLADGTPFTTFLTLQNNSGASYQFLPPRALPEPNSALAAGICFAMGLRRPRRSPRVGLNPDHLRWR